MHTEWVLTRRISSIAKSILVVVFLSPMTMESSDPYIYGIQGKAHFVEVSFVELICKPEIHENQNVRVFGIWKNPELETFLYSSREAYRFDILSDRLYLRFYHLRDIEDKNLFHDAFRKKAEGRMVYVEGTFTQLPPSPGLFVQRVVIVEREVEDQNEKCLWSRTN